MKKVILISGKAESGKDSTANILKEYYEQEGGKVLIVHFADLLKFYAKQYFGWDGNKDEYGRKILQVLGTDIVRAKDANYWVNSVIGFIKLFKDDFDYFIIPDCRFPGEIECFRDSNFPHVHARVIRNNFKNKLTAEQLLHPSETSLDNYFFDYVIESESGLNKLKVEVTKFITWLEEDA